jgi:hypothetical protein
MDWLITEITWWGLPALIFYIDSNRRKKKVDVDPEQPDLSDKSVWPWMVVMTVAGALTLPIYFWSTRKRLSAVFAGAALSVMCIVLTLIVRVAAMLVFGSSMT